MNSPSADAADCFSVNALYVSAVSPPGAYVSGSAYVLFAISTPSTYVIPSFTVIAYPFDVVPAGRSVSTGGSVSDTGGAVVVVVSGAGVVASVVDSSAVDSIGSAVVSGGIVSTVVISVVTSVVVFSASV